LQAAKGDDPDKMVSALEGYKFLAPKGVQAIRPQDHAMLQPMFRVKLVTKNGRLVPQILGTATTYATAPPVVAMRG
jgi:branched-chain amino acid transport system substrate-binding protein